ncbi:MAG: helix-turn-helix domain-containing protein [Thermogemmatispora sp.]|uniref:NB-ARC domain-containing protein n=1 Tax=Thermogemmatispora sp. TaxID=1968838 RepID=UPI002613D69A|nr:NB-ARC domain-containing protein [Thermogemmatispora sp.]MBX5459241.1 helix-turn-helix domain-containing protein [Thermogemmatispora sp.]
MKPNLRLRHEREMRGWSQARVAEAIGSSEKNVSRWERGVSSPQPYYREKLCQLFGKSARELGFVEDELESGAPAGAGALARGRNHQERVIDPTIPPLPNEGRGLVGRTTLLGELVAQLCAGRSLALCGLPGVGKTALAVTLVHEARVLERFEAGVLWAGLGPRPNVLEHLHRWEQLLGVPAVATAASGEQSLEARARALRAAIGQRRFVLVIDDVWELEAALAFKVGGPQSVLIATTRFPRLALAIAGEGARTIHELESADGLALLAQWAPEVVAHDRRAALTLVEEVGGLPLALTLLGKYLQAQAHSGQPRRLQAALARLRSSHQRLHVSEMRGPLEQPPHLAWGTPLSLQSAIAVSDQQLDEQVREVLRALSVFPPKPNSFSEEAALAVAQAPPETLDALVDAGLLESSGTGRYLLHQTIADYASAHLRDPQAGERLVAYVTQLLERHGDDDAALELESRNIVAGLQYAFENGRHARFIRGVLAFTPFLRRRGFYELARLYLQRAYQIAIWSSDPLTQVRLLLGLGEVALHQGDLKAAGGYLREGLTLAREGGQRRELRRLLRLLRYLAARQDDAERAAAYGRELAALAAEEAAGD